MLANHLIIGTRGSKLALAQTKLVADALKRYSLAAGSELTIETKIITTKGDVDQSPIPLDTVGKAWFTSEIEQALLAGEIDLAIHSLKDLPPEQVSGLTTMTVLKRGDPRDVLISKGGMGQAGVDLKNLPSGSVIGTDSVRRKVLLLDQRPDVVVKSVRGNVDTRIKKLNGENVSTVEGVSSSAEKYDAIVLAAAGLERLGMLSLVTEFFDPTIFLIAPGQGILAAQARADEKEILELLRGIEHTPTRIAAEAEQSFSRGIGGGCKLPIGCYARVENNTVEIYGMMGEEKVLRKFAKGSIDQAIVLAEALAKEFLK